MHAAELMTGWDTAVFMLPFFGLLGFWMFGLDERLAAPKKRPAAPRFSQVECEGRPFLTDPDGKPWHDACRPMKTFACLRRTVENPAPHGGPGNRWSSSANACILQKDLTLDPSGFATGICAIRHT